MIYVVCLLMGVIAGLRTMTAAAAVSWAAYLGLVKVDGTWLMWLGSIWTVVIFTVLALGEFVTDQLPSTPSRKVPVQFGGRVVIGIVAGIAIAGPQNWVIGAIAGLVGAVIGTLGGAAVRGQLAVSFGKDGPAAFLEDAVAVIGAALLVLALR